MSRFLGMLAGSSASEKDIASIGLDGDKVEAMTDAEADAHFQEVVGEGLSDAMPDGISVTINIDEPGAVKRLLNKKRRHLLDTLPQEMKDIFEAKMHKEWSTVGAAITDFGWGYNYAPKITWVFQGDEYQAYFYLDGTFQSAENFVLENADQHTIQTIIVDVAPQRRKK